MPGSLAPPPPPFPFELQQMRQDGLPRHLEQILLEAPVDERHQGVWRRLASAQRRENLLLPLATMIEVPAQHGVRILDHRAMTRKQAGGPEREHAPERREGVRQVAAQVRGDVDRSE